MPQNFFVRLRAYFENVAAVLRGQADTAGIFPNPTDIGFAREKLYVDFLRLHAPAKCNVFLGGYLFDFDGAESRQMDVIVSSDMAPRYDLHNRDGAGKSFAPVEGALAVASVKSTLDERELRDALNGIASIPPTRPLTGRQLSPLRILNYPDWPYKIVYASNGISPETLERHIHGFFAANPAIPSERRPNMIHVAGKYLFLRVLPGMQFRAGAGGEVIQHANVGSYKMITRDPDVQALAVALSAIQRNAQASAHILYEYDELIDKINRPCS